MYAKIQVISLIVFMMFAPFIPENSYALSSQLNSTNTITTSSTSQLNSTSTSTTNQTAPHHFLTYALAQIEIRNSQGQLVSYLEAKDAQVLDPGILNQYLDTQNATGTVDYGYIKFELFQFTVDEIKTQQGSSSHADIVLSRGGQQFYTMRVLTDGFWYDKGDKVTQLWTVVRTA